MTSSLDSGSASASSSFTSPGLAAHDIARLHLLHPQLVDQDDDQREQRHRDEEADEAEELADDHDADRHRRRVQLDPVGHHQRNRDVALDLLDQDVDRERQGSAFSGESVSANRTGGIAPMIAPKYGIRTKIAEKTAKKIANSSPITESPM